MKILAIDDEILALQRLKRILEELNCLNITISTDPQSAFEEYYDLIFLDINMPQISGIELAKEIFKSHPSTKIVFQTAHENFALEAFEVGSIDYLLKPISTERVEQCIKRVQKLIKTQNQKLMVKLGSNSYLLNPSDVCYIKADLAEVYIKAKNCGGYMSKTIGELETSLQSFGFFRVHRSYLVNIHKIKSLSTIENSKLVVKFHDIDDEIITSKDGAKYLRNFLDEILI